MNESMNRRSASLARENCWHKYIQNKKNKERKKKKDQSTLRDLILDRKMLSLTHKPTNKQTKKERSINFSTFFCHQSINQHFSIKD
jgi:hypothetical protein